MKAIIQAGGAGTRLKAITGDIPKPMVPLCGKPILQWQIENLKAYGVKEAKIVIGKNGGPIREFFKDGSSFGLNISYIEETQPLGTAGGLYFAKEEIGDDFILLFGDLLLDIDWDRFIAYHKEKGSDLTPFVHPNSHPYDSDLLVTDDEGKILSIDSKNNVRDYYYDNLTNAGLYICSKKVLDYIEAPEKIDFEKKVLTHFIEAGNCYAYVSSEYVKDCGTPDRYESVQKDIASGIVAAKNLSKPQRCIFLDRDGTLNVFGDFVKKPETLELKDDAPSALRRINASGYLAICITNQPIIARGDVSFEMLKKIHQKLFTELGKEGAYLDALYFCPHHPHSGFPGEVRELKFDCDCRKPKIGMLLKAKEKYNIDLSKCWFIGDTKRDIQTAINAGCKSILITTGDPNPDAYFADAKADYECESLTQAIDIILGE